MRDVIELSEVKMLVDDIISLLFTEDENTGEIVYHPEHKLFVVDYCIMMYYAGDVVKDEDVYSFYQKWLAGEYDSCMSHFNTNQLTQITYAVDERIDVMKNRITNHLADSLSNLINVINDGLEIVSKFIDDVGSADINGVMEKAHNLLDDIHKEEKEITKAVTDNVADKVETTGTETISEDNAPSVAEDNENS